MAAIVPTQSCGCPRLYPLTYGHHCIVHDDTGKRWDAYTFEDVCREWHMTELDVVTVAPGAEMSCYCGRHRHRRYGKHYMNAGERGVWTGGGGETPEYEFECEHAFRQNYIDSVTTDWIAMAIEDDKIWRAQKGYEG